MFSNEEILYNTGHTDVLKFNVTAEEKEVFSGSDKTGDIIILKIANDYANLFEGYGLCNVLCTFLLRKSVYFLILSAYIVK